ncbi:hypothetical protein D3C80_1485940 [compost metagenome]
MALECVRWAFANQVDHTRWVAGAIDQAGSAFEHFYAVVNEAVADAVVIAQRAAVGRQAGYAIELEVFQFEAARVEGEGFRAFLVYGDTGRLFKDF